MMRKLVFFLLLACAACTPYGQGKPTVAVTARSAAPSFDGADYSTASEKLAHGSHRSR
jgi:hypothetical protein